MQATSHELREFARRRQEEDVAIAAAYVADAYRGACNAFDLLVAYLGRYHGDDRRRTIDSACRYVEQTIYAEKVFLAACQQLNQEERKGLHMWKWINRALKVIAGVGVAAGTVAALPGVPAKVHAAAVATMTFTGAAAIVAAKVLPGHGPNSPTQ